MCGYFNLYYIPVRFLLVVEHLACMYAFIYACLDTYMVEATIHK